jgi:hypothetical protein
MLEGLQLVDNTRTIIRVDMRPPGEQSRYVTVDDQASDLRESKSLYKHYISRPIDPYDELTYFEFLLNRDHSNRRRFRERPRAKPRILSYFPAYDNEKDPENFARCKLMLHHPHRSIVELKMVDGNRFGTHLEAYHECLRVHPPNFHAYDAYGVNMIFQDPDPSQSGIEEEEDIDGEWRELAGRLPHRQGVISVVDIGSRDVDMRANWTPYIGNYDELEQDWWSAAKDAHPVELTAQCLGTPDDLTKEQRVFYDVVMKHYELSHSSSAR